MFPSLFRFLSAVLLLCAAATAQVKVTLNTPTNNSWAGGPAKVVASAYSPNGMSSMAVFVDNKRVYFQWGDSMTTYLWISNGWHTIQVQGTDVTNQTGSQSARVYSLSGKGTVSKLEDSDLWQNCTEANCAGGEGTSTTFTAPYQTSPSL